MSDSLDELHVQAHGGRRARRDVHGRRHRRDHRKATRSSSSISRRTEPSGRSTAPDCEGRGPGRAFFLGIRSACASPEPDAATVLDDPLARRRRSPRHRRRRSRRDVDAPRSSRPGAPSPATLRRARSQILRGNASASRRISDRVLRRRLLRAARSRSTRRRESREVGRRRARHVHERRMPSCESGGCAKVGPLVDHGCTIPSAGLAGILQHDASHGEHALRALPHPGRHRSFERRRKRSITPDSQRIFRGNGDAGTAPRRSPSASRSPICRRSRRRSG